jgi:hypothetical protein
MSESLESIDPDHLYSYSHLDPAFLPVAANL